jgi:YggT family protein
MGAALLDGLAAVVSMFAQMIQLLVIASVIVSWVGDRSHPIVQMIYNITEPMYRPLRRLTSRIPGPIDWAPMALLAVVILVEKGLVQALKSAAARGM